VKPGVVKRAPTGHALERGLAAIVCLLFVFTLFDVPVDRPQQGDALPDAPALPVAQRGEARDASLRAVVVGEGGGPIGRAVVRVFSVIGSAVYLAAERRTDEAGIATMADLPAGETWVLAYAAQRAWASAGVTLTHGATGEVTLTLSAAQALRVVVTDESDAPVASAPVLVDDADALPHVVATDDKGEAVFERLGAAPWVVSATAAGYDPATKRDVFPGPGALRLQLEKLGAIEVVVLDPGGEPAQGATVTIGGPTIWPSRAATTGDEGTVRIAGLRGGIYDLRARLGDQVSPTEMGLRLDRGETARLTLTLDVGREIAIRVTDGPDSTQALAQALAGGRMAPPIEGAEVVIAEDGVSTFPHQGRTGSDGEVVLGPVAEGRATVTVTADGFVPRTIGIGPEELEAGIAVVALSRGGAIVGRVEDDRGYPIPGATLEVVGVDFDGMPIAMTAARSALRNNLFDFTVGGALPLIPRGELGVMPGPIPPIPSANAALADIGENAAAPWVSGQDGRFEAAPVVPGRLRVLARHPDYVDGESELVRVGSAGRADVKIVLLPGGRLEGRVREKDGMPVAGARVQVASTRGSFERSTYTAADGTFSLAAVPPEVLVSVSRPESPMDLVLQRVVEVPKRRRTDLDLVLPPRREDVDLRVVDDRGFGVRAEVRVESLDVDTPYRRTVFTDDKGVVAVPAARGLPVRIVARAPGRAPLMLELDALGREERIELGPGLVATGRVTGNGGRARVAGASITIFTDTEVLGATSRDDGSFEVKDLAPGRVRIVAFAAEWSTCEAIATIEGDGRRPIELGAVDLPRAGTVEGTVVDENGDPVAGARVGEGAVPTWLPLGPLPRGMVLSDRDGRFVLPGLPEGDVRIEAYEVDHGRGAEEAVPVRAERTRSRVEIRLQSAGPKKAPAGAGSLALTLGEEGGRVVVVAVPNASEAEAARVLPGDALTAIDAQPVRTVEAARKMLSGPLGQDILLELKRDTRTIHMRVRREVVRR